MGRFEVILLDQAYQWIKNMGNSSGTGHNIWSIGGSFDFGRMKVSMGYRMVL